MATKTGQYSELKQEERDYLESQEYQETIKFYKELESSNFEGSGEAWTKEDVRGLFESLASESDISLSKSELMNIEDLNTILAPHTVELKNFVKISSTPFRLNAFNGVYAPAKSGKTYFVLEQLNSLDTKVYTTVWLDGDRNSELKDKFINIHHIALGNPTSAFRDLINNKRSYDNFIFIIDSYKDFNFGLDTDTNKGSQEVFEIYQHLLNLGATLVIIFHTTNSYDGKGGFKLKLKGNADTIESKMDFLYKLERNIKDNHVNLTVQCSREQGLNKGDKISFADKESVKNRIREVLKIEPTISLRDLKKKEGLSSCISVIESLEGSLYNIVDIKPSGGGRPKQVLELIE